MVLFKHWLHTRYGAYIISSHQDTVVLQAFAKHCAHQMPHPQQFTICSLRPKQYIAADTAPPQSCRPTSQPCRRYACKPAVINLIVWPVAPGSISVGGPSYITCTHLQP